MKISLLINMKMTTIVGIFIFISIFISREKMRFYHLGLCAEMVLPNVLIFCFSYFVLYFTRLVIIILYYLFLHGVTSGFGFV